MPKITQTPGTALSALLEKHNLNYNRLAKAIGLSSAMVRLIARDENPVSAAVAFRLAAFFKMKPEDWLSLQMDYDLARTAEDKKLAKALKDIPTVDKATFERKRKAKKAVAPKQPGKRGRPAKAKPSKTAKTATKSKKTTAAKKAAPKKAAAKAKAPTGKRGRPAKSAAVKPAPKKAVPSSPPASPPAAHSESSVNEPKI